MKIQQMSVLHFMATAVEPIVKTAEDAIPELSDKLSFFLLCTIGNRKP